MIPIAKEIVRYVRGTALPLQRLRLANPNARLTRGVLFDGREGRRRGHGEVQRS